MQYSQKGINAVVLMLAVVNFCGYGVNTWQCRLNKVLSE
jgi:hypothetical protein